MKLKYVGCIVAFSVMTMGCSRPSKNDFAGFAFDASRSSLEEKGFVCKDGERAIKYECVNLDWTDSVLGQDARGLTIGVSDKKGHSYITTDLKKPPMNLMELAQLHGEIGRMYKHMPEKDEMTSVVVSRMWKRNDGSIIALHLFPGGGGIPTKAGLTAYSSQD